MQLSIQYDYVRGFQYPSVFVKHNTYVEDNAYILYHRPYTTAVQNQTGSDLALQSRPDYHVI